MNQWSRMLYNSLNVYERNVFGCCFDIYNPHKNRLTEDVIALLTWLYCKWERYIKKDVYFKYLEVPITTRCSLRCRECNNLIQVYQNPEDFDMKLLVQDIRHISRISKQIRMLRILGGEPLLHPDLDYLLKELAKIEKIKLVRIVTNGTLMFNKECLSVLGSNPKFSVDISNYGKYSSKYDSLKKQLQEKRIHYITQREQKPWKAMCNCRKRGRSVKEIKKAFSLCRDDCHSLLNGGLHLCPRSSHGADLGLVPRKLGDFVPVRRILGKRELKERIYRLLNVKTIEACDYCDMFQIDKMQTIPSAEQITKSEGMDMMKKWKKGK